MDNISRTCLLPSLPDIVKRDSESPTDDGERTQSEYLNRSEQKSHPPSEAEGNNEYSNEIQNVFEKVDDDDERVAQRRVKGEFPLSELPSDTLLHVFSFLKKNEQLRMSGVCKLWRQLVFSSPDLWRARQLTLRCNRHASRSSRNAYFYARRLGRYLHKISVTCEHPNNHSCRSMAVCFRKLLTGLKTPGPSALRTFKVTNLRLRFTRTPVLLDISTALERLIYSFQHLKYFQMSNAHWPAQEGLRVINSVLAACQNSLHTLRIDGFFLPRFVPSKATEILSRGLGDLTCLSKLSIDYFYLSEQSVITLASSRQGQLRVLKLVACDVSPHSRFVSRAAWLTLTRACPSMRVKVVVQGFTVSPARSLPLLLSPALRLHKLRLTIGDQYTFLDMPRLNMAAVLSHVTRHFRRRLSRFEMDIDNHNDSLDAALVRMVRKCRNLVSVKVTAYFNSPDTDTIVRDIVRARRDKDVAQTIVGRVVTGSDVTRDLSRENTGHHGGGEAPYQDRVTGLVTVQGTAGFSPDNIGNGVIRGVPHGSGFREMRAARGDSSEIAGGGESNLTSAFSLNAGLGDPNSYTDRRGGPAPVHRDPAYLGIASTSHAAAFLHVGHQ